MLNEIAPIPLPFKTLTGIVTVSPWQIEAVPMDTPALTVRFKFTIESQPFAATQVTL